uniref:Helitron helicase-like domain-containing protein n=1 Tax=Oryza glaberrima TaxID=4538 RepID=I1P0F7_ORYGL
MDSFMDDDSDDEYYMFAGLGDDEDDEMVQSDDDDTQSPTSSVPDPFDYVYSNIPQSTNVLKPEPDCKHYGAKRFQYELPSFCCRDGEIKLVQNETPPELMRLWTSSDPDAKHFRDNIRYFNGHFSFTTLGLSLDKAFANMSSGMYTFRAHGQICHNIHSFSPRDSGPEHLELYFYDDDPTLSHRFERSPSLDQDVIRTVADVLRNNPYSETFRSLGQAEDLANYRVTLNLDHRLDQRRYNVSVTTEQFAVDMYIKVESSRLDYVRNNQKEIRADLYQGLMDSIQAGESRASAVGKRTVLPASFVGVGRNVKRRYMDAMALVQKYGKPDVFLTMTSNPKWDEITRELDPGQTPQDRPDLVVRVFRAKLEDIKKQLFEKHILGKVIAHVYVVEF